MKIDSNPSYEDSFVLWLQAGSWYADIRANLVTGEVYSGFGGVVWWNTKTLYFQHLINISGELSETDIGTISLTPWGCFERGEYEEEGEQHRFEEKWFTKTANKSVVLTRHQRGVLTGLEVQNDEYCLLMEGSDIQCFKRIVNKQWRRLYGTDSRLLRPTLRPTLHSTEGKIRPGWKLREVARSS